jgi:hypothetical protein
MIFCCIRKKMHLRTKGVAKFSCFNFQFEFNIPYVNSNRFVGGDRELSEYRFSRYRWQRYGKILAKAKKINYSSKMESKKC